MATIKLNRQEFEKRLKLTDEIIDKISLFGTPVEKITSNELELEILPNRPDLLSIQGFLRAFKAFLGKEHGFKRYKIKKPKKEHIVEIDSSVSSIRPYTTCAIIKNLSLNNEKLKEIIDLQEKLHATLGRKRKKIAIGIYPLDKIKFPIKYVALPLQKIKFIPLDFDKELSALEILKKHPTGKEYAHLLSNFDKFPVFIDSSNKILSMPPIINSNETGKVDISTKNIFVECSGDDFNILKKTLNIIASALSDMGGEIYSIELKYKNKKEITPDFKAEKMPISLEKTNKLLGLNLKEKDLEKLLPKMCYNYKNQKVEIPPWRTDILHEIDIIEDIAIAYGYQNLIPELPNLATNGLELKESKIKSKISEILIGLGLLEISSYHLIKQEEAEKIKTNYIELENSKTEYKYLRPNLLIPMLRTLSENKDSEYPQKLFEIGSVFSKDEKNKTESGITEKENLIIASTPGNFTEIKQIFDYLSRLLDIPYKLKETILKNLIEGRTGEIMLNGNSAGYMGEIHPKILQLMHIKMPVSVLEISLEDVYNLLK